MPKKMVVIGSCIRCPFLVTTSHGNIHTFTCGLTHESLTADVIVDSISDLCPLPDSKSKLIEYEPYSRTNNTGD